jgi:hypothetical protein|uniref:Uncharacterized protein n=1 Tax=Globisporangium ultimum (strain ATCC 200006 / CBS 805.95 / DAOM BR144) TaxID=431595 RepID=K3WCS4_GLOUD
MHGYRVCNDMVLDPTSYEAYRATCDALAETLDGIFASYLMLGYNFTRDALRIVEDVHSSTMTVLRKSLPVLIMLYWDNGITSQYNASCWDGSACMFRLSGNSTHIAAILEGVSRSERESKTIEWLD